METVTGFIAGYLVGSREGKAGAERLRESWNAIRTSPEVHRMATEALSVAGAIARDASSRGIGELSESVARMFTQHSDSDDHRDLSRAA